MPAKSKKQQMADGAALSAKRGKRSKSSLKGASRGMYKSMSSGAASDGQDQVERKADKEEAALNISVDLWR